MFPLSHSLPPSPPPSPYPSLPPLPPPELILDRHRALSTWTMCVVLVLRTSSATVRTAEALVCTTATIWRMPECPVQVRHAHSTRLQHETLLYCVQNVWEGLQLGGGGGGGGFYQGGTPCIPIRHNKLHLLYSH